MLLKCLKISSKVHELEFEIRPAPTERDWIEETPGRFAARCLPLLIANAHGWEILFKDRCEIVWNGGSKIEDTTVTTASGSDLYASSHFGQGIVTFRIQALFQTDAGVNLWVGGPINRFKDAIQPLTGVVETDWLPFTFTMNWKMTRPHQPIIFERDEPICHVFPIPRGIIDDTVPELVGIESDPDLARDYEHARDARREFNEGLKNNNPEIVKQSWQRHYFRGSFPSGRHAFAGHDTKLNPKKF
jgi:hypothetical protein